MIKRKEKNVCSTSGACSYSIHAPCRTACPVDQNAPLYIRHIARGEYADAWNVILADNPFGLSCGLVCHHPCEQKCRAGEIGDPIGIRALKRYAAERAKEADFVPETIDTPDTGKKVAVVGGGPAGLTAAHNLRKQGHSVTVFEATDKLGGMLTHTIPDFRLPKEDVKFDLDNISASGLDIRYNQTLGSDITVKQLKEDFDAVFVAFGSWASWKLDIGGEDIAGVERGIDFLKKVKAGEDVHVGDRVLVIGGGNVAIDVARVALRMGAKVVNVFYRRKREKMRADNNEIAGAEEEGIHIHTGWGPVEFTGANGSIGAKFHRYKGEIGKVGKTEPGYSQAITTTVESDQIFIAIGEHPQSTISGDDLPVHVEHWGGITVDKNTLATTVDGVFAGGDCVTGPSTLVAAVLAGKTAARSIGQYLRGEPIQAEAEPATRTRKKRKTLFGGEILSLEKTRIEHIDPDIRKSNHIQVEKIYSEDAAVREAKRCLECDLEPKENNKTRRFMQFASLFGFNYYLTGFFLTFKNHEANIYSGSSKIACIPGLHCYSCPAAVTSCPIGAIQFWLNNAKVNFRPETLNLVGLYVIGFLGMIGAAVGRASCGWVCPFGLFQDLMYKIPAPLKVGIPKFLKYFKYIVLLLTVLLLPFLFGDFGPVFCKTICPSGTLVGGIPLVGADPGLRGGLHFYFPLKMTILIAFIIWMILAKRPFCRTTCPLGAIWSFFNRYSILNVRVNPHTCDDCNSCRAVCPVDIHPQKEVRGGECIRCMNCLSACQTNSLEIEIAGLESAHNILEQLKQVKSKNGVTKTSP